ncbi:MAG: hypothetical protein Q9181_003933 [Wetmoreana brouardii]
MTPQEPDASTELRNILRLNGSNGSLVEQIQEACEILEITLPSADDGASQSQQCSIHRGPREEWTLRWLLKKLAGTGPGPRSILVEPQVWLLFRELVLRLPIANLARLLRNFGFLEIMLNALKSLEAALPNVGTPTENGPESTSRTSSESCGGGDSSSATVRASVEPSRTSQKRRRDGTPKDYSYAVLTSTLDIGRLHGIFSSVVSKLQTLTQDDVSGYATEHLKIALITLPDQAADILSRSLIITNQVLRNPPQAQGVQLVDWPIDYVNPWVQLWKSRSANARDTDVNVCLPILVWFEQDAYSIQLLFSLKCFIPTLETLTTINNLAATRTNLKELKNTLEALLLQHILLPVRDSFETLEKPPAAPDSEHAQVNLDELLAPLSTLALRHSNVDVPEMKHVHPIAHFYGIVLKHTTLSTPKQRISGKSWLRSMFDRITGHAFTFMVSTPRSASIEDHKVSLRQMLELAMENQVKLESNTLEKVLTQYSNILDAGVFQEVDWSIVRLCLHIDPDLFINPAIPSNTIAGPSTRGPNRLLTALFSRLSGHIQWPDDTEEETCRKIVKDVLSPLVNSFAQVRDLSGFVNFWRSNLMSSESVATSEEQQPNESNNDLAPRVSPDSHPTVWEHEDLLQVVAKLVGTRLVARQIEDVIQEAKAALKPATTGSVPEQRSSIAGNLVILDCVLHGCMAEDTIFKLSGTVSDVYLILLGVLESENLPHNCRWRVYRCMATIKQRWKSKLTYGPDVPNLEQQATRNALQLRAEVENYCPIDELLQSFNYVLSVIGSADSQFLDEFAKSIVDSVTTALKLYGRLILSETSTNARSQSAQPGPSKTLQVLQEFLPPCISHLCSQSGPLLAVTPERQTAFFRQLFKCNLLQSEGQPDISGRQISFGGNWQKLLHLSVLEEHKELAATLRNFQLDILLGVHASKDDGIVLGNQAVYALALDSIQQTPVRAFERKQRSAISNWVLESLLQNTSLSPQLTKDHLKVLISFLAHPNRSMVLLQHLSGLPKEVQDSCNHQDVPALFQIAKLLDSRFSSPHVDTEAVDLLTCLALKVLE